jgi:hypothetical protein
MGMNSKDRHVRKARRSGRCRLCGRAILVGQLITDDGLKFTPWVHVGCIIYERSAKAA